MKCNLYGNCINDATHYFSFTARKCSDPTKNIKWGVTAFCDKCSIQAFKNAFWKYTEISIDEYEKRRFRKIKTIGE